MVRDLERDILPMARHYGMALAPWGVAGRGKIQTKAAADARNKSSDPLRGMGGSQQTDAQVKMSATLEKIAKDLREGYSVVAVAIAYLLAKAPRVFPIVGGRKVEQLHENIRALEIRLTLAQVQGIESVAPFDLGFPMNFIHNDPKVTGERGDAFLAAAAFVDWQKAEPPVGY